MAKRAGKFGKVIVGTSTELSVQKWTAKDSVGEDDVTQTTDQGYGASLGTIKRIDFTLEAVWDSAANPYAGTPAITPGEGGPRTKLFINRNDTNPLYDMTETFISDVDIDASVPSAVKYTITGKSNGTFTTYGS